LKFSSYILIFSCAYLFFSNGCGKTKKVEGDSLEIEQEPIDSLTHQAQNDSLFGFPIKGLSRMDSSILRNQFFADILLPFGISHELILKLADGSKQVYDIRKLRAGNAYSIFYDDTDSTIAGKYLVYEIDPIAHVVFCLDSSARIYRFNLPVDTVESRASGIIDRTLYHTIMDMNAPYELGVKLSEIFAWQVDFFFLDKGDEIKVIYEKLVLNGKTIGIGNINASLFIHRGDSFYAFNFNQDSLHNYFDENGKSLRKAFLKAPLKYSRISSRYTLRRFHPVQKRWKAHLGTDYAAPTGTPIYSVGDGTVVASGYTRGNGNYVKVKHNGTYTTQYLHMSRIHSSAKVGRRVRQGQVIGYVGKTGLATGPHLCFRFWQNGRQVDPFRVKIPPSDPIKEANLPAFNQLKGQWMLQLEGI
jgi:murein DD-endopeptidase MepM/ murein hydrolase activator NlpD